MKRTHTELELKTVLRQRVMRNLSQPTGGRQLERGAVESTVAEVLARLAREGYSVTKEQRVRICEEVVDDALGYGPLQPLMTDPTVTEIMVNGPGAIFVERSGRKELSELAFDSEQHLRQVIEKMLRPTGKRLDESSPFVDIALPDGSRVNVVLPPIVVNGPYVTIRRFLGNIRSLDDLVRMGTIDPRMALFLWASIRAHQNMIFSGATGSGKTTLMEVLAAYIDERERIVTIEDTPELTLKQPNVARMLTRAANLEGKGEITFRDLFLNCLRMRPTRILLGEIRGREAAEYLQALNSGHQGSLAVLHASSPEEALLRMEHLVLMSGIRVPLEAVRQQLSMGLDVVVQINQMPDGVRRVVRIGEVADTRGEQPAEVRDIFVYHEEGVDSNGAVRGRYIATGYVPKAYEQFRRAGLEVNEKIFARG